MRLPAEFIKLPLTFDAARLAEEIAQFDEADWRPHPEGHRGNWALPLVAASGDPASDAVKGPMRPTPHLARCPYVQEVLASLRAPIGRTRLMRIDGNAEATPHIDSNYYWMQRARVHVPVVTDPAVMFLCGGASVHMGAGEAWIFDTSKTHNVINPNPTRRIHLVADTKGSPEFREMAGGRTSRPPPVADGTSALHFESHNFPVVMSPEEQASLVELLDDVPPLVRRFLDDWRELWHLHGESRGGWAKYRALLDAFDASLDSLPQRQIMRQMLVHPALNPELDSRAPAVVRRRRIERPVFIVSSPRAGSTLLFETLAQSPGVFTTGGESHTIIEGIDVLHPAQRGWESNRLTAEDASPIIASVLETRFLAELRARDGSRRLPAQLRMLEKTPKNSLRIPFLRAIHPDAFFIYLYRDPRATISSMLDAWRSGKFVTYPRLPGWEGPPWSLVLVPGWRGVNGKPLEEIVAHQWSEATRIMLDDLESLDAGSWCVASYDALVTEPQKEIERLCAFTELAWDRQLSAPLPLSRMTLTAPAPDKWLRNGEAIDRIADRIAPVAERARELFARTPAIRARVITSGGQAILPVPNHPDGQAGVPVLHFRSVHTSTLPEILKNVRASLAVSTYQSGRVVFVRRDGEVANTHFLPFESPMGIAQGVNRLAIGTAASVVDFRQHDARLLPRNEHVTGDIRVHEIAFDGEGTLWMVNTRFSALCTLDEQHSFVPRWTPPFIADLAPEDRCHLNGLAMIAGRPRLVTVLGETNTPGGWRANKATGGALIDVDSGKTIVRGLSMPHSPRWYAGKIWLLESGKGTLICVDTNAGRVETVAQLPGFTRGLAFAEHYAFIGLSQVRESVFDGIPLAKRIRLEERSCGVWAVDIRNGNIVAFLRFEDAVQEIFDVQVLHGMEFPELLDARSELVRAHYEMPGNVATGFSRSSAG
ncbi:MAG TPA: TIGR03032 family protein [Thermoanaerobaculia bacterium]|nr:TIGR03032 family protein [Thermoanaerobaculia bacterium]